MTFAVWRVEGRVVSEQRKQAEVLLAVEQVVVMCLRDMCRITTMECCYVVEGGG